MITWLCVHCVPGQIGTYQFLDRHEHLIRCSVDSVIQLCIASCRRHGNTPEEPKHHGPNSAWGKQRTVRKWCSSLSNACVHL